MFSTSSYALLLPSSHPITSSHPTSFHLIPQPVVVLCHFLSFYTTSSHLIELPVVLFYLLVGIVLYFLVLSHFIPSHYLSCHLTSSHAILPKLFPTYLHHIHFLSSFITSCLTFSLTYSLSSYPASSQHILLSVISYHYLLSYILSLPLTLYLFLIFTSSWPILLVFLLYFLVPCILSHFSHHIPSPPIPSYLLSS